MIDVSAWNAFAVVCRTGSISAAAGELGYTQSAVSRQIANLERELGARLLDRLPRGIRPTPAGSAALPHALEVVSSAAAARAAAEHAGVTIGAVPSAAAHLVPAALARARAADQAPHWSLRVGLTPDLEDQIGVGRVDLAVVSDAPPGLAQRPGVSRERICVDEYVVLLPPRHDLAGSELPLVLAELSDEVWVEDNAGSASVLRSATARVGFEPRIDFLAGDLLSKVAVVAAGLALAVVPRSVVPALRGDVVVRALEKPPQRGLLLARRTGRDSPAIDLLAEMVRAVIGETAPVGRLRQSTGAPTVRPRDSTSAGRPDCQPAEMLRTFHESPRR